MNDERKMLDLQFFAEGAAGDGAGEGEGESNAQAEALPNGIPERARKIYEATKSRYAVANAQHPAAKEPENAAGQQEGSEGAPDDGDDPKASEKKSYRDLIRGEYAEEHREYMEKAISDRMRKYRGMEDQMAKQSEILKAIATKYELDPSAESFLVDLKAKVDEDDSYLAEYATKHDIPVGEARKMVEAQRKAADLQEAENRRLREESDNRMRKDLYDSADKTKERFPEFDLDAEMQNPAFKRICAATGGDTTAAYYAVHHKEIESGLVEETRRKAASALANNRNRPVENGANPSAAAITTRKSYKGMSLEEIRAEAKRMRQNGGR